MIYPKLCRYSGNRADTASCNRRISTAVVDETGNEIVDFWGFSNKDTLIQKLPLQRNFFYSCSVPLKRYRDAVPAQTGIKS